MKLYKPNYNDSRVRAKILKCLVWCASNVFKERGLPIHSRELTKVFGNITHPFSKFLRAKLLVITDSSYEVGEKSKEYALNQVGFNQLSNMLNTTIPQTDYLDKIAEQYTEQLLDHNYHYKDEGYRLFHPLIKLPKLDKQRFWNKNGLPFNYDIESAAPTILLQLAVKKGLGYDHILNIQHYINDRVRIQFELSEVLNIPVDEVKGLVISWFNGGRISNSSFTKTGKLTNGDVSLIFRVEGVTKLIDSIKHMWKSIGHVNLDNRWKEVYFKTEREVLNQIVDYLDSINQYYFLEYDGFRTNKEIDVTQLIDFIFNNIGVKLKFKLNKEVQ